MALGDKVLVATDLSEGADEAIRQGYFYAQEGGGRLVVCHVVHETMRYSPLFPQRVQQETEALIAVERQAANAVEQRVMAVTGCASDAFEVNIIMGAPEAEILRVAEEVGATLIVTGSRGLTGIRRLLLGNVAERVVRYAHCPVLVTRQHDPTNRILAPTDLSEHATPGVNLAGQIALRRGCQMVVMHSLDIVPRPAFGFTVPFGGLPVIPPPEVVAQARTGAEEVLTGLLDRLGVQGERRVVDGDAATTIIQTADQMRVDLVVVSTHGRTGLARVALGSVAEKVVRGAHCSVLVVRSH